MYLIWLNLQGPRRIIGLFCDHPPNVIVPLPDYRSNTAFVSVLQCTAPMSQPMSQPAPQQAPHPAPQQPPQPITQRQEIINNTETLGQPEVPPNPLPFPANTLRSSSPKLDPSELYLKSKAMLDSKRTCAGEVFSPSKIIDHRLATNYILF